IEAEVKRARGAGMKVEESYLQRFASTLLLRGLLLTHAGRQVEADGLFKVLWELTPSLGELYLSDGVRTLELLPPSLPATIDYPVRFEVADRVLFASCALPEFFSFPPEIVPFSQISPVFQLGPHHLEFGLVPPGDALCGTAAEPVQLKKREQGGMHSARGTRGGKTSARGRKGTRPRPAPPVTRRKSQSRRPNPGQPKKQSAPGGKREGVAGSFRTRRFTASQVSLDML
ncbi:hypothetical protein KIPB_006327, partial [Kipferlia bialata]